MTDWRPVPIDYFTNPPKALTVTHFASGASAVGDMRGFARLLYPFGVATSDLGQRALEELANMAHLPIQVFVDSGAFSEVETGKEGWRVCAPIGEGEWARRIGLAYAIASMFGHRALVVAPDQVGNQHETLARLARYVDVVRAIRAIGARVVVPIQIGSMSAIEFDLAASAALGFADFVRGIPGNKAAMATSDVRALVRAARPSAVHLLGVGLHNSRLVELMDACRDGDPNLAISCDSNLIAAHVGRTNGRGGQPRAMTAAEAIHLEEYAARSRESAIVLAFGPAVMWRRAVEANLLGNHTRYSNVGMVKRSHGDPIMLAKFGDDAAKQLTLFR